MSFSDVFLQDTKRSNITIDTQKPTHLMIIADGGTSGAQDVVATLAKELKRGLLVSHPADAKAFMKGVSARNKGRESFVTPTNVDTEVLRIVEGGLVGSLLTGEVVRQIGATSESETQKAISKFIDCIRTSELEGPSAFVLMNNIIHANIASLIGQARAVGCLFITVVKESDFCDPGKKAIMDILKANHQAVLNSSSIYNVIMKGNSLVITYSQ